MSESTLIDILERMPQGVALLDWDGRTRYVNSAAVRIVGKPRPEVIGRVLWDAIQEPIGPALRAVFDQVLAGQRVLVLRNYFAQGLWYEVYASPIGNQVLVSGNDVTERLQAEALRRQTEERFRILVDGVKDYALALLDPKGQVASWNAGGERLFGYALNEIVGQDLDIFYPPESRQLARRNLEAAVAHGHHQDEGWRVRKDGSRLLAVVDFYPLYDELGQASGFAILTCDITERRRLEQKIRTSEERLRLAIDAAEVGTWDHVMETDSFYLDDRVRTLFDLAPNPSRVYTREEIVSRIHPEDRERNARAFNRALAGGGYSVEYRVVSPSEGTERWIESRGKALSDDTGRVVRLLGALRDVTERHRYEEFRRLLPGIIAHDLRAPLSTIQMASFTLCKNAELPEAANRSAQAILRGVSQMATMIDKLLDFTQARFGGGIPLDRTPADLAQRCQETVLAARVTSPDREMNLSIDGDCHGVWDNTRIDEVISNLLNNAVKFGPPGQPIDVTVRGEDDNVVLTVHNLGGPIPAELLPALFDPFRRAERAEAAKKRGQRSYGLGLYITRAIILAHGGTIDVSSSSEAGTTFVVRLPRGMPATTAPHVTH